MEGGHYTVGSLLKAGRPRGEEGGMVRALPGTSGRRSQASQWLCGSALPHRPEAEQMLHSLLLIPGFPAPAGDAWHGHQLPPLSDVIFDHSPFSSNFILNSVKASAGHRRT